MHIIDFHDCITHFAHGPQIEQKDPRNEERTAFGRVVGMPEHTGLKGLRSVLLIHVWSQPTMFHAYVYNYIHMLKFMKELSHVGIRKTGVECFWHEVV